MSHEKILVDKSDLQFLANSYLLTVGQFFQRGHGTREELQAVTKQAYAVATRLPHGCSCMWGVTQAAPRNATLDFRNTEVRKTVPRLTKVPAVPSNLYPRARKLAKKLYALLINNPEGLTSIQISENLDITSSATSSCLKRLCSRNLVKHRKIQNPTRRGPRFIYEVVVP